MSDGLRVGFEVVVEGKEETLDLWEMGVAFMGSGNALTVQTLTPAGLCCFTSCNVSGESLPVKSGDNRNPGAPASSEAQQRSEATPSGWTTLA